MKYTTIINGEQFEVEINADGSVLVNGKSHNVDFLDLGNSLYSVIKDYRSLEIAIDEIDTNHYELLMAGRLYEAQVLDERAMLMLTRKGGLRDQSGEITAPMPGLIVEVQTEVGQIVTEGDTIVVLESMKMQNELRSALSGVVQAIHVEVGQSVDKNALLAVIAATPEENSHS